MSQKPTECLPCLIKGLDEYSFRNFKVCGPNWVECAERYQRRVLWRTCGFWKNRRREDCTFHTDLNVITFTRVPWHHVIFWQKGQLVRSLRTALHSAVSVVLYDPWSVLQSNTCNNDTQQIHTRVVKLILYIRWTNCIYKTNFRILVRIG